MPGAKLGTGTWLLPCPSDKEEKGSVVILLNEYFDSAFFQK